MSARSRGRLESFKAKALGKKGGMARAKSEPERWDEIAKKRQRLNGVGERCYFGAIGLTSSFLRRIKNIAYSATACLTALSFR